MPDRSNAQLNFEIERQIRLWDMTVHGIILKKAYEGGADYETICEIAGIDIEDYEEE